MTPAVPRYNSAGSSEQGYVRPNNEDRVHFDDARGFYLVVDGMGGHEAGEQAAAIAVDRIKARLERQTGTVEQRVREAIALANNAIYDAARLRPEWHGMACVLTVAVIDDGQVTIGHVGDSRLYRIQRGKIEKITHDHSPVGEREDSGELTEADAMRHPRRNEVFRDVGSQQHAPDDPNFIEIAQIPFDDSSALLLCTDGLSDALSSQQILDIVAQNAGDRWAAVRALIAAATERGKDNVSAVLVEGARFAQSFGRRAAAAAQPARRSAGRLAFLLIGLVAGVLLGVRLGRFLLNNTNTPQPPRTVVVVAPLTIAAALDTARPGDTVSVPPGTYDTPVQLKSGVDLVSTQPRQAILAGGVSASNVQNAGLEAFLIRGGVRIDNSDVIVSRDEITGSPQAGIEFNGASRGAVVACSVHDNNGPGIAVLDTSAPAIENNVVFSNRPGLLVKSAAIPVILSNIFLASTPDTVSLPHADPAVLDHNYFTPPAAVKRPSARPQEPRRERR